MGPCAAVPDCDDTYADNAASNNSVLAAGLIEFRPAEQRNHPKRRADDGEHDREVNDLWMNRSESRDHGVLGSTVTVADATTTDEPADVAL